MEVVMQWLDELDDLVSMVAARAEGIRRMLRALSLAVGAVLLLAAGAVTTLLQPVIAAFVACLLGATFLYTRQQNRGPRELQAARD